MKQRKSKSLSSIVLSAAILISSLTNAFYITAQTPDCQWGKTVGHGLVSNKSVATDNFGNEYVTGFFRSPFIVLGSVTLFNNGIGTEDFYLAKYDHLGNLIWARSAGGSDNDFVGGVATDSIGNIYLTGYYTSASLVLGHDTLKQQYNIFTMKYDPSGNILWARGSVGAGAESGGITTDKYGNSYVTGIFGNSYITFDHNTLLNGYNRVFNIFITKYTTDGNVAWVRGNNNLGLNTSTQVSDIKTDADGNILLTGSFGGEMMVFGTDTVNKSPFSDVYVFLIKMDSSGNFTWVNGFGNFSNYPATVLTLDASGNSFLSCNFGRWPLVLGTDTIRGTAQDAILVKYNSAGARQWAKKTSFNSTVSIYGAACDQGGNVYMTGQFSAHDLTFGADTLAANDTQAMFLLKYDNDGNQIWAKGGDSCNFDQTYAIAIDPIDNIYLSGYFAGNTLKLDGVLMNPGDLLQPHAFLAKYSTAKAGINNTGINAEVVVYPNPATNNSNVTVKFSLQAYSHMDIYNYLGQRVYESSINSSETLLTLATNNLVPGNYFIRLCGNNNTKTIPIIILP